MGEIDVVEVGASAEHVVHALDAIGVEILPVESVENSTDMFTGCTALEGAILYDPVRTSARYANYVDGYFTYKDPTAIAPATRTVQDEPIVRYDLQGRRLTAPQKARIV